MKLFHNCKGPASKDPYPCGRWLNLGIGWLRIWPLCKCCWGRWKWCWDNPLFQREED